MPLPATARAIARRIKWALKERRIPSLNSDPTNVLSWVAQAKRMLQQLPPETRALIQNHALSPSSPLLNTLATEIRLRSGDKLRELARQPLSGEVIAQAVEEIVKQKTIIQCTHDHRAGGYYDEAEKVIVVQWANVIWPIIQNEDFTHTVDLACGHGRNTEFLRRHASSIDLIDVNETCLLACRHRFGAKMNGCEFRYHLTAGDGMPTIPTGSVTFVYSFDSMVHFDKVVMRDYVKEVARVLTHNGSSFLHHSNYGTSAPNSDWFRNPGTRSDMTAELMRDYAAEAGLKMRFQRLSGTADGWGLDDLDCLSLLAK